MAVNEQVSPTDLFLLDELLSAEERQVRNRVRDFCDTEVLPIINEYSRDDVDRAAGLGATAAPVVA